MEEVAHRTRAPRASTVAACLCACLLVVLSAALSPTRALASTTMPTSLSDDADLVYGSPAHATQTLQALKAMGVDEVKVSVVWSLVAPDAKATTAPSFDATDPGAYPAHAWDQYDLIDRVANQLGLKVYFQVVPPAPAWAVAQGTPTQGGYSWSEKPNAVAYGQFVQAVGTRYSGSYGATPASTQSSTDPLSGLSLTGTSTTTTAATPALPRVSTWGLWNEPNEPQWLNPQTVPAGHHRSVAVAPAMYRALVDRGYAGLSASGHQHDTILIGETASLGSIIVASQFTRDLYCVGGNDLPLRGAGAKALGCPASGGAAAFVGAHPGLFHSAGFAEHPYSFDQPPSKPLPRRGAVTLQTMPGFERMLDRIFTAYGQHPGLPIYVTEYGYKTNPPNPYVKTSLAEQATWDNQGEYMAFTNPRILSFNQFLLADELPRAGAAMGSRSYWSTFQTGLEFSGGTHKPGYAAFELPIWLPRAHTGSSVVLWGQLRQADHTGTQTAQIQYRPTHASHWGTLTTVSTTSPEGFLLTHVAITVPGTVRLAWTDPSSGTIEYSRTVAVS